MDKTNFSKKAEDLIKQAEKTLKGKTMSLYHTLYIFFIFIFKFIETFLTFVE